MDTTKLFNMYVYIRSILHWVWLAINEALWHPRFFRKTKLKRKVVVVGDETAWGFGDWIVCTQTPGYAKYLQQEVASRKDFKFKWTVQSSGVSGATTDDWLPGTGSGQFEKHFDEHKGTHFDADFVVLHLGFHDKGIHPGKTAKNLMAIAEKLVSQGKRVIIQLLPTRTADGKFRSGWILSERNTAIKALFKDLKDSHIYLGADIESFKRPELFCFDGFHLSSKGYRRVAKETYQVLKHPIINIEWLFLQPGLQKHMQERNDKIMEALSK
eukprot:TRINITY_DN1688_c0_g1_i1.p1 TRINITY_DN1688_c0_g1~~TRINITY_DN1688_c0_g1_i1.p1  ORF type:complete len:270 (+),score=31.47 TRINITY_DN1688_c0_g1_i1:51-860(+)